MFSRQKIKDKIHEHINNIMGSTKPRYSLWYCGITNNTNRRKVEHGTKYYVQHWNCWESNSKKCANEVEKYFSELGTKNSGNIGGARQDSVHVYIFKVPPKENFNNQSGLNDIMTLSNEDYIKYIVGKLFA